MRPCAHSVRDTVCQPTDVRALATDSRVNRTNKTGRKSKMNRLIRYKGYQVAPAAQRLPNGLFAANLTIEKSAAEPGHAYSFDALDYFFDEEHALAYAFRWGRLWVDDHQ
jgi:hypothetical protein